MKFFCSLIVVDDVYRSRKLYESILGQKVIADFGEFNVSYEGGLAFYQRGLYQQLIGKEMPILDRANNLELYFEEDNLAEIEKEIEENGFEIIHKIREEPWKQQAFRFYDYDNHIVVIAETMDKTIRRLHGEDHSVDDIAKMTGLAEDQVLQQIAQIQEAAK